MSRRPELAMDMFSKLQEWTKDDSKLAPHVDHVHPATDDESVREAFRVLHKRAVIGKSVVQWRKEGAQVSSIRAKL